MNSYIALRSFVFLFNLLICYQFWHLSYHSCLASEFLLDLIGEYKEFFTELTELFHFNFFLFCRSFLFYAWRNYNVSSVSFLSFILGLFYTRFSFNFSYIFSRNACLCIFSFHHALRWYCNKQTLIEYGACSWSLQRTPPVGTRHSQSTNHGKYRHRYGWPSWFHTYQGRLGQGRWHRGLYRPCPTPCSLSRFDTTSSPGCLSLALERKKPPGDEVGFDIHCIQDGRP